MAIDRAAVVRRADELVSQGKLDLAIAEYRALVDEQPGDLGAANALGDLYARAGETARAIDQFTRLAESERAQGFTSKAIALYKKALKVDPACELALSQLAEIAAGQELLADATLYWNRLVQHRRERNDARGVAEALMRLAALPVAKADTRLAAARAADPHVDATETARLYAAAADSLGREGRTDDALNAWLEASRRTTDVEILRSAALACLEAGCLERADSFLSVETAGDEPRLLWAIGERAALADDESLATRALGRYRALVPDDAERAAALLAKWAGAPEPLGAPEADVEPAPAPVVDFGDDADADEEEVDLSALLFDTPTEPEPEASSIVDDAVASTAAELPYPDAPSENGDGAAVVAEPVEVVRVPDVPVEAIVAPAPVEPARAPQLPEAEPPPVADPPPDEAAIDEAETIAQLQAAADTPALQFQAAAQLGRWFLHKGQFDRSVEWLERACAVAAPAREQGLAARYDLADALERAGQSEKALACWSDLEFEAGSYRDVPERLERLTRTLGSAR